MKLLDIEAAVMHTTDDLILVQSNFGGEVGTDQRVF